MSRAFSPHQFSNPANPNPPVRIVAIEPTNSAVLGGQPVGEHDFQGLGAGFIPDVLRVDLIDETSPVSEVQAYETDRQLAQREGILSGISTRAAVYAGLHLGQRDRYRNQRIVIIPPTGGERYPSMAMWHEVNPDDLPAAPPVALNP